MTGISLTFPTSATAMAHANSGNFLGVSKLLMVGYYEVILSLVILFIVFAGALIFFLKEFLVSQKGYISQSPDY